MNQWLSDASTFGMFEMILDRLPATVRRMKWQMELKKFASICAGNAQRRRRDWFKPKTCDWLSTHQWIMAMERMPAVMLSAAVDIPVVIENSILLKMKKWNGTKRNCPTFIHIVMMMMVMPSQSAQHFDSHILTFVICSIFFMVGRIEMAHNTRYTSTSFSHHTHTSNAHRKVNKRDAIVSVFHLLHLLLLRFTSISRKKHLAFGKCLFASFTFIARTKSFQHTHAAPSTRINPSLGLAWLCHSAHGLEYEMCKTENCRPSLFVGQIDCAECRGGETDDEDP